MKTSRKKMERLLIRLGLPRRNKGFAYLLTMAEFHEMSNPWDFMIIEDIAVRHETQFHLVWQSLVRTRERLLTREPGKSLLAEGSEMGMIPFFNELIRLAECDPAA